MRYFLFIFFCIVAGSVFGSWFFGGGGTAGPEVEDTFTDSDSTELQSHTTDSGHSWSEINADVIITSNEGVGNTGASHELYYVNHTMSSADYYAEVTVDGSGGTECSIGIRSDGAAEASHTAYFVTWFPDISQARLYKTVSGTPDQLGSSLTSVTGPVTLKVQASGTTITGWADDTQIASETDSDISAAGFVVIGAGLRGSRNGNGNTYDNLEADTL